MKDDFLGQICVNPQLLQISISNHTALSMAVYLKFLDHLDIRRVQTQIIKLTASGFPWPLSRPAVIFSADELIL